MLLTKLRDHISRILDLSTPDIALNGIQVANAGVVNQLITAVDFSEEILDYIIKKYALTKSNTALNNKKKHLQIAILVHHGMYWGKVFSVTGRYYRLYKKLLEYDIALLGYHLPLDIHPRIGNNILLLRALGCRFKECFGNYKGVKVLFAGTTSAVTLNEIVDKFNKKIGKPLVVVPAGSTVKIKTVGVCTGGGLFGIEEAKTYGCEVFVTGDAGHTSYHLAKELDIHLISGGHYNTEVLGIKTLGEQLGKELKLPVDFIDLPTGL